MSKERYESPLASRYASAFMLHLFSPDMRFETWRRLWVALARAEHLLCEITGMDAVTLQPAAGAHGEFLGLLLIKAYHHSRGDTGRTVILVPDSAHGTNPASAPLALLHQHKPNTDDQKHRQKRA